MSLKNFTIGFLLIGFFLINSNMMGQDYYSRQSGPWEDVNTWSTTGHGGSAASKVPAKGDYIVIGDNDAVTISSSSSLTQPGISLEVYGGGSLTEVNPPGGVEIYIKTGGTFKVGESGSGTINVDHLLIKNNATCYIYSDGSVTTQTYVDNNQSITVDGELIIGTYFNNTGTVTGTGTISASSYTGSGTTFGVTNSTITGTISGYTWNGGTSTVWTLSSNWSQNEAPSISTHDVVIPGGLSNYPVISSSGNTCGDLLLESGASLTINETYDLSVEGNLSNSGSVSIESSATGTGSLLVNGSSTGNITVNRFLTDGEWHLVASSTSGVTANNFFWNYSPSAWLTYHTETTNAWTYNTDLGTSMPLGQGWSVWLDNGSKASATATMTGTLQVTDFTASLSYSGSGTDQGWNLLGNPFTTAIDWDNGTWGSNTTGTVYVWDNDYNSGDYRTWNGSAGDLTDGVIPISQGFFVKASSAGDFSIPSAARVISTTDIYKSEKSKSNGYARFQLSVGDHGNTLFIGFPDNGTSNYDYNGDADKLYSSDDLPQMYAVENGLKLCINALQSLDMDTANVPVHIDQAIDGKYTLTVSQLENLDDISVTIFDLLNGTSQNLNKNPVYEFYASTGDSPERFNIQFSRAPSAYTELEKLKNSISVYSLNNQIRIHSKGESATVGGFVSVFNITGRLIMETEIEAGQLESIPIITNEKVLVVRVTKSKYSKVEKLILK